MRIFRLILSSAGTSMPASGRGGKAAPFFSCVPRSARRARSFCAPSPRHRAPSSSGVSQGGNGPQGTRSTFGWRRRGNYLQVGTCFTERELEAQEGQLDSPGITTPS